MHDYSLMNLGQLQYNLKLKKDFSLDFYQKDQPAFEANVDKFLKELRPQLHAHGEVTLTREEAEMMVHLLVHADFNYRHSLRDYERTFNDLKEISENRWFKIASRIRSIFIR